MNKIIAFGLGLAVLATPGYAQAPNLPTPNSGDSAWIITASALVLMMTIPGL